MQIVSLFSGSGGLDLGFELEGYQVLAAYDKFKSAVSTYNTNRAYKVARLADVSALSGEEIACDLGLPALGQIGVIGGPPCQAFSRSNVYPKADDIRRTLPGHFARLLNELQAIYNIPFFLFENVQGLTFKRHRDEFARFRFLFEEAGFTLFDAHLNAIDFGVPQDRPRVFIVGINKDLSSGDAFEFPNPSQVRDKTVHDAFESAFGEKPWPEPTFFKRGLKPSDIAFHPNHWTMVPRSDKFRNGTLRAGEIKGRSFRVLAWEKPSWTVAYGHREIHVHPSGKRRISIFEAMQLQAFPRSYVMTGTLSDQVKLVSDAVPPPLAQHLARSISNYFGW